MKLPAAHLGRIRQLGYTDSEARFLYIVAVFSGYFTMRQFRAFAGSRCGKRPSCFAQKLLEQEHARVCAQVGTAALFHLFSRTVYGPMDKDSLRNRKRQSFEFMRTRWTTIRLDAFQKKMGAATTVKWNNRKEQLILRFTRGDQAKPFAWGRPLSEQESTFRQLG